MIMLEADSWASRSLESEKMSEPDRNHLPVDDGLIRVSDANAPIYRIFPLWFFEESLRLRQLALVAPSKWEDPFEVVSNAIAVDIRRGNRIEQVIINQSLPPAFAQCWSRTGESDSLLRAYSRVFKDPHFGRNICPRNEGVRVRSSPRKLLQAVRSGNPSGLKGQWFIGAVIYLSGDALLQEIANAIDRWSSSFRSALKSSEVAFVETRSVFTRSRSACHLRSAASGAARGDHPSANRAFCGF